ncbi:MAG: rod shape-determining protein MreC [Planctomycetota bacterium]
MLMANLVRWLLSGRRLEWALAAVALALCMLPERALLPWTNDLGRVVAVPLVPVAHVGVFVRERLRPTRVPFDARSPEVLALEQQVEFFRSMHAQSMLEAERLERAIAALGAVTTRAGAQGLRLVDASVVGTDPSRVDGTVLVNAGSRHGVREGSVVLVDGDVFAGRVSADVGAALARVVPAPRLSGIGVRLLPAEGGAASAAPGAVLKAAGDGTWTADVASSVDLREGMVARVADDRFPRVALGTRIGTVVRVEPIDEVPLARRVRIRPLASLDDAVAVVVAAEQASDGGAP